MNQNNLEKYRQWYEVTQTDRETETERLEQLLDDVETELEEWEDSLEQKRERYGNTEFWDTPGEVPNPHQLETRRYYQGLWRWKWDIERRIRDLIRGERDDLEWLGKLEVRKRARTRATEHLTRRSNYSPKVEPSEEMRQSETRVKPGSSKNRQHKKTSHKAKTDV
ncbi:MAG: hypothetical protein ABI456_05825 [Ktedonobacteraceae bacterium]